MYVVQLLLVAPNMTDIIDCQHREAIRISLLRIHVSLHLVQPQLVLLTSYEVPITVPPNQQSQGKGPEPRHFGLLLPPRARWSPNPRYMWGRFKAIAAIWIAVMGKEARQSLR